MKFHKIKVFLLGLFLQFGCVDTLQENVYSELTPGNFLNTENGKLSALFSAYGNIQLRGFWSYFLSTNSSGEAWNRGGSVEALITPLSTFTWESDHPWFVSAWAGPYQAIRDANIVIDNTSGTVDGNNFDKLVNAEARFIRALAYNYLYDWFGPVPIFDTSTPSDFKLARSTDAEIKKFIEAELLTVSEFLPLTQAQYGRATKGAALGILSKFYLNNKDWQKCVETTKKILDLNRYSLVQEYKNVFSLQNEGNSEMLWVIPAAPQAGHNIVALTFPTDYRLPQSNQQVFAARSYFFDSFVNSFEIGDKRKDLIITEYINTSGKLIKLLGINQSLSGKYEFDPNAAGATQGNDIPVIRYADILLSRAEALNEIGGPTQEVMDLINAVRLRAKLLALKQSDFSKVSLRNHILQEREWEFYAEIKRREDLIRHGKFISNAVARGAAAQPFHLLFPIPIIEINANPNLVQNSGY